MKPHGGACTGEPRWFFYCGMKNTVTREQKEEVLNLLKINNLMSSTASDERERKIWRKAFDLYNYGTGNNLTDTTCNRCCEAARDWLLK